MGKTDIIHIKASVVTRLDDKITPSQIAVYGGIRPDPRNEEDLDLILKAVASALNLSNTMVQSEVSSGYGGAKYLTLSVQRGRGCLWEVRVRPSFESGLQITREDRTHFYDATQRTMDLKGIKYPGLLYTRK